MISKTEKRIRMRLAKRLHCKVPENPILRRFYNFIMILDRKIK